MTTPAFSATAASPLDYRDGYPALEDLGLIGDGGTAALVARDGAVVRLCVPRFGSEPLFCSLLDTGRGGSFRIVVTLKMLDFLQTGAMVAAPTSSLPEEIDPSTGAFLGTIRRPSATSVWCRAG